MQKCDLPHKIRHSPKAGRFETNIHAKKWRLTCEDGAFWEFTNLYNFVRNYPELFNPSNVKWKRQGEKRGTGGEYCNVTAGLLNVASGKTKSWKGWHISTIEPA
ncbi:hypothetical protein Q7523_08980 [Glaesserella parasuis]|uniref:hypothetical protein n=1 Tax=Glaesserella parasuis TaxID=738 RepID=UPI001365B193|nr:hypothetical protein [Glaesserella parasuis]MDG6472118.1 hypothetical protein [Glaesserella parasuis]MDO9731944.1 hypothetical protein [Glaesserella parasuis]MDO9765614.1 hypothetical protein [Glaesserella parasuis]MDO9781384.1 hypothetical protein [Glaesserella parasuis]MWQ77255.1 hypothetical protein [Glaesserella parasuis]